MSLSTLLKTQLGYKSMIEKAYVTFKKSPKDRLLKESHLLTRMESLEEKWKIFSDTHKKILADSSVDELAKSQYVTENIYECVEEAYIEFKTEIREYLSKLKPSTTPCISIPTSHSNADTCNVRLPKISIPTFTGSYAEWTTFKDLYESLVHKNTSIDDVQKMHYLKGHLSGEAEQLLRHVPITAANYQESWSMLHSRYNNKKYLSNCLLKRFVNQPSLGTESSSALKSLLDVTSDTLNGLRNLGIDVNSWDTIVIYLVTSKLDAESRKLWESKIGSSDELPALKELKEFLEMRFRSLEFVEPKRVAFSAKPNIPKKHVLHAIATGSNAQVKCMYCKGEHRLSNCKQFSSLDFDKRHDYVQTSRLCFNCFGSNHSANICRSVVRCHICRRKHHSLLHPKPSEAGTSDSARSGLEVEVADTVSRVKTSLTNPELTSKVVALFSKKTSSRQILLATALVEAEARDGNTYTLRALLDQGSEASFVTESAAQLLGLKKIASRSSISGLGGDKGTLASKYVIMIKIQSRHDPEFQVQVRAHVLNAITSLLPSEKINHVEWPELAEITLADPQFHKPSKIDILLGADVYGQLIREGLIKGPKGVPTAQRTALGWIISGPTHQADENQSSSPQCHHSVIVSMHAQTDDNALLRKFWEIESIVPEKKIFTAEEQRCEEIYTQTTVRDESGRYVVNLPFRTDNPECQHGRSRDLAVRRFQYLERKFEREPEVKRQYSEVFHDYLNLGHMERVPADDLRKPSVVYLPHHAVIRNDKTTTKVRIVFDASMKGTNGVSLNSDLMVGPTLQPPLRHIIMRWRLHPISLCADVIKMYRQVKLSPAHVDFHRVVWRDDPASEMEDYRLLRVTFGTASAPYLAVKSLQQVAVDEGAQHPETSEIIKNNFYVDDLMAGCQSVEEGLKLYKDIETVLTKGGFQLQKWVSSCKELEKQINVGERNDEEQGERDIKMDEVVKILGITWDREEDEFRYSVVLPPQQIPITKRRVISDISRLFDPLGWAAPCVVTSKIFIQKLWLSGLEWDDELTPELATEWHTYRENLLETSQFSIPRWVKTKADDVLVELHGFCDASEVAYAAAVYIRVIDSQENIKTSLITSRTKVSPVKQQSIPRLELMGAVLLSELIVEVAEVIKVAKAHIHAWTDSTVVLAWLSSHPSRWSTFVGNRVSAILTQLDNSHWAHVQSAQNPADIASRGITPQELVCSELWAKGPTWLVHDSIDYTRPKSIATSVEQRGIKAHVGTEQSIEDSIWTRFSSLQRLVRVIAYCRRVLKWKNRGDGKKSYEEYLTKEEIADAMKICIKEAQKQEFSEEIEEIKKTGKGKPRGKLKSLCPIIDDDGILRVSGRLQNSDLDENQKHPIIMPHHNHFSHLLIAEAHKTTLHGGPTLMLHHLRTRFWIISAKPLVKRYVRNCVKCKRYTASVQPQLMGQLPASRVTPARAFRHSGVDFAGPISIRSSKGRGHQSSKGYICLFICMVSKAIHLEAISDLSSQGFIAGFKRFVARRGAVTDVWSDNGTNFVGASKELRHLVDVEKSTVATEIGEWLGNSSVTWHFIPPHAPNFGGLWEAGVKSTKFHLRRVIGTSTLTYEELSTVLSQVEACLNSRPLSVMSDGVNDPMPLTPGHFLIGESLITVSDRNFEDFNMGSLKRWQVTQRMLQEFWRKWSQEYLVHLLQRYKWNERIPEPNVGDIVLVKEDNLPPARWLLGKVTEKHPGLDKITRVVTLKCNGTLMKRPVSKLCVLPVSD